MRAGIYRSVSMLLTAVFLLSSLITGTLGWQSLGQSAKNETQSEIPAYADVELLKLEKLPDGTETEIPVPGAAFFLFTADGRQVGGRYVTDSDGKVSVSLKPGEYYFEESSPAPGFAFDKDEAISTHESGGDAFVTCLDGVGRITIDGVEYILHEGESIVMPAKHPHAVYGAEQFKMLLVVVF